MSSVLEEKMKKQGEPPSAFVRGLVDGTNKTDDYLRSAEVAAKSVPTLEEKLKEVIKGKNKTIIPKTEKQIGTTELVEEIKEDLGER